MSAHNLPYATIVRSIPIEERERVFVERFGPGITSDRQFLGTTLTGIAVRLDDGSAVVAPPQQIRPYVDGGRSNVVMFPSRVIA